MTWPKLLVLILCLQSVQEPLKQRGPISMESPWGLGRTNQVLGFFTVPPFIADILIPSLIKRNYTHSLHAFTKRWPIYQSGQVEHWKVLQKTQYCQITF